MNEERTHIMANTLTLRFKDERIGTYDFAELCALFELFIGIRDSCIHDCDRESIDMSLWAKEEFDGLIAWARERCTDSHLKLPAALRGIRDFVCLRLSAISIISTAEYAAENGFLDLLQWVHAHGGLMD